MQQLGPCAQQISRLRACGKRCLPHSPSAPTNGLEWAISEVLQVRTLVLHALSHLSQPVAVHIRPLSTDRRAIRPLRPRGHSSDTA
jgi:hypothetical protein